MTNEEFVAIFSDPITTALEGGSNFWYFLPEESKSCIQKYSPSTSEGFIGAITNGERIRVIDAHSGTQGTATKDSFLEALSVLILKNNRIASSIIKGECEVEDADILFQLATLGQIIYI